MQWRLDTKITFGLSMKIIIIFNTTSKVRQRFLEFDSGFRQQVPTAPSVWGLVQIFAQTVVIQIGLCHGLNHS